MSRRIHLVLTILILVLTGVFLLTAAASAIWNLDYAQSRWGVVAAKGRVLGPNNKPIWVEYDADGNVVRDIGEAHEEPLENAEVISGHAYRTYEQAYRAVQAQYTDIEVLSAQTYQERTFMGPDGQALSKPALAFNTNSVVVRDPQSVYGSMNLVLLQSVLDLNRLEILPESVASVLLSSGGWVITTSQLNIGFRTAFYTPKESLAHEVDGNWHKGKDDMAGLDMDQHKLWGPIQGVEITGGIEPTSSDSQGRFRAYRTSSCDTLNFVNAKLRYNILDPQDKFPGHYILTQEWQPDCWWVPECLPGAGPPMTGGGTLAGVMAYIAYQNQCMLTAPNGLGYAPISSIKHNYTAKIKFHVDVVMVSGAIRLRNPAGSLNVAGGDNTAYRYTAPLFTIGPTDGTRVADTAPDFTHQGLLATISEADLKKTDLYIFRTSNDQLLMAREGLADDETLPYFTGGIEQNEELIKFNLLMRGPASDRDESVRKMRAARPIWLFENHQKATGVNPELYGRKADHLRIGETVKVVAVNRATGYIGTGTGRYGSPAAVIGDSQADVQSENVAQLFISPIYLAPPNLKIKVERKFDVDAGLTKGQVYKNIIGFEGAGLSDDNLVAVSTQWYDHDGTPLPAELPGYTGRLARVVSQNTLGSHVDNFEIKPGKHLQLVRLPRTAVDTHHYYLHISGEPVKGNPDFGETGAAPDGPLQYRPAHYVPIRVPLFDEAATVAVARAQAEALRNNWQAGDPLPVLDNIEKIYRWVYRPEMQFSVLDFEIDPLELVTTMDETTGRSDTRLNFTYDLLQDAGFDPLDPLGPGRQLIFGLGYGEILALLGEDRQGQFASVDELMNMTPLMQYQQLSAAVNSLQPQDYLGLQLYQNDDAGNQLAELYGLPLLAAQAGPMHLVRQHYLSKFDNSVPGGIGAGYTDDYRQVRLELFDRADVTVNLLNANGDLRSELISQTRLSPGPSVFLVDYADLEAAGFNTGNHKKFLVEVLARAVDGSRTQRIHIPGTLDERTTGKMLGQIMVHDVMIQDGSLNLSRSDVSLAGRGPELAFARTYSNQPPGPGPKPLGPGWRHNYQQQLTASTSEAHGSGPVPAWAANLKGAFFRPSQIPEPDDRWNTVSVNGTTFKLHNGAWYPERGRHGSLSQNGGEFIYTAKDGTRYYYDVPRRTEKVSQVQSPTTTMHAGDSLITRINLRPEQLLLPNDQPPVERKTAEMPGPSPVKRIEDRNGNALTFTYEGNGRLAGVTDAVGRKLTYEYQLFGTTGDRLTKVSGPDGIEISFAYNDDYLLQSVTRANRTETYAYTIETPDAAGAQYNLTAVTDANDHTTRYEYYSDGELDGSLAAVVTAIHDYDVVKRVIYPDNNDAHFAYNAATDNLRTVTDLRGNDTVYYLNYHGNPLRIVEPPDEDNQVKQTLMTWSIDTGGNDNVMLTVSFR
jgi:YD repeat-containing protein